MVRVTVDPEIGKEIATFGGMWSLKTVNVTGLEGYQTPRRSSATALKVWDPLLVGDVFQGTEYGAVVSADPRLLPSSWNCTRWTVRAPTMLTFALTAIVPPTVDPDVGDVMVTTRLPTPGSWARAGGGEAHVQARIPANAVVRAIRVHNPLDLRLILRLPFVYATTIKEADSRINIRVKTILRTLLKDTNPRGPDNEAGAEKGLRVYLNRSSGSP
jgi:hypothetical protein